MPAREVWELLMAGAGGVVLAELGSTFRDSRSHRRARAAGDALAQLAQHDRLVHLEAQLGQLREDLDAMATQLREHQAVADRLTTLGELLADTHDLLLTVVATDKDPR